MRPWIESYQALTYVIPSPVRGRIVSRWNPGPSVSMPAMVLNIHWPQEP